MKFYVTYGCGTDKANQYSEVEADGYEQAREHVFAMTDGRFSFIYSEEEFPRAIERWGLTLAPLGPMHRVGCDEE